jgi:hypothetical protein
MTLHIIIEKDESGSHVMMVKPEYLYTLSIPLLGINNWESACFESSSSMRGRPSNGSASFDPSAATDNVPHVV